MGDFNKLNNMFISDDLIDRFKLYLENKPEYKNKKDKRLFKSKHYKQFILENNKIFLKNPKLEVIKNADIQETLKKLYEDDPNSISKGIVAFYKFVCSKYLNISRDDCELFLKNQNNYQITRPLGHYINKPIIAKYPNQMWCVDLIEMTPFNKFQYIFNCIDVFSRYVWLEAIKTKDAVAVTNALKNIVTKANISPDTILCDNGTEFAGEFKEYCDEKHIKLLHIPSHSPQANGLVERANKDVRKIINGFLLDNSRNRWVDVLPKVAENKNTAYNSTIKALPAEVWVANKDHIDETGVLPKHYTIDIRTKVNLAQRAMKLIDKYKEQDNFEVGDYVRVKMSAMFSNVRKLIKEGKSKQIVVTYTPEIYRIKYKIHTGKSLVERNKYVLETNEGLELGTEKEDKIKITYFYASDLIEANEEDNTGLTMEDALKLNGVKSTKNDIQYIG